jgi:hypothetical protein
MSKEKYSQKFLGVETVYLGGLAITLLLLALLLILSLILALKVLLEFIV